MKILFLSFYYQPDLSAGSFRAAALMNALLDRLPSDAHIELITTLPNRYSSFAGEAPEIELLPRLTVHRMALPAHKSGMLDQSRAFIGFAMGALRVCKGKDYDLVFATSSRLMTAVLGAFISRKLKKPLYLDIRDIFVDTIKDVLPRQITWAVKPVFSALEGWTFRIASKVNLVSRGFLPYFQERYPQQNIAFFTNGIDAEFIAAQPQNPIQSKSNVLSVVYAGNMGEGQGLHAIIPELGRRFAGRLQFKLIGDGGRKQELLSVIKAAGCRNVEVLPPVKRDELIMIYQSADILFLHLNNYDAFTKVLPSKLFEYGALGKPIWAGLAGHAADFVNNNIPNSAVFSPCNAEEAETSFAKLAMVTQPRHAFVETFDRSNLMREMAADIVSLAQDRRA